MKFALIGDVHGFWDEKDNRYFNESDYDAIFFTGDFGGFHLTKNPFQETKFEGLTKKAYLIPGNWDGTNLIGVLGEATDSKVLKFLGSFGYARRMKSFSEKIRPIALTGYSSLVLSEEKDLALIVGRPHSMGGGFNFARNLAKHYFIADMETSVMKYKKLIDSTTQKNIFFLSHNGPQGLGSGKTSIYGADYKKEGGDGGDLDLAIAVEYAKDQGKKVPAVLSGHMHHFVHEFKKERETMIYTGGTFYVNGAKVPRIRKEKHFHTKITWDGGSATVIPVWESL
ncbi:metallophosphoesterase [Leptospira idonii]|uniref:Phosphoesterase n=1 Tax=Leptospira idonii TaxID=1193500 RepID=A0A4R9LYX3_9LEPT|nr:metallophosphoesterase [Leptospira idonii]TGN17180.1 phosphoesterase [Leptospira idonii]